MPQTSDKFSISPPLAIVLAGALVALAIIYTNHSSGTAIAEQGLPQSTDVPAPSPQDHWYGSKDAPVVLVEYSDFQCPYCSLVYSTLKKLVDESNGQVAWVIRNFPLESIHPQARPAASAAECIAGLLGNDGFWKYADSVFNNQDKLNIGYSRVLALSFGADAATYDACVAADTHKDRIEEESAEAMLAGGTGTPFTVIWSKNYQAPLSGALPYAQFKAVINAVQKRL